MTNKKFKVAAMSMALTACVAAQPLIANAADDVNAVSNDAAGSAPQSEEGSSVSAPVADASSSDNQNHEAADAKEAFGENVDVNYHTETKNEDGSTTETGDIVKNSQPETEGDGEQTEGDGQQTEGDGEQRPEVEKIGEAEKTEKDNPATTETTIKPGAESIPDESGTRKEETTENPDGSVDIKKPTLTPGTETTTTTGKGTATGTTSEDEYFGPEQVNLKKELGDASIDWDTAEKGAAVGESGYTIQGIESTDNSQTLTLVKEDPVIEGEMTAEDIAKLVDAKASEVDSDGYYTLTRTETYKDESGNEQTRTTYIKVKEGDSHVTIRTTTTLVVSRERATHTQPENNTVEVRNEFTLPDITMNNDETITSEKLQELLNQAGADDSTVPETYTVKEGDREYTITVNQEAAGKLSAEEIADYLGSDYKAEGDKVYYIGNGQHAELSVDQEKVVRERLSYTVKVKETKKDKETVETGKDAAIAEAKDEAVRDALTNAVAKMLEEGTITEAEAKELNKKISDDTIHAEDGGTFQTDITVDGVTKHFELDYSKGAITGTDKTPRPEKDSDQTTDNTEHTVKGNAYVFGGTVVQDNGGTVKNEDTTITFDENGKVNVPDAAKGTETYDEEGRLKSYKIGDTTYEFEYGTMKPEDAKQALGDKLKKDGWTPDNIDANITTVSWTATTTKADPNSATDIYDKGNCTIQQDEEKEGKYNISFTGGTSYNGFTKTGDNTYTGKSADGKKDVTITVTDGNALSDTDIEKLIRQQYKDIPADGSITITGNTATYTGTDGNTHTVSIRSAKNQTILVQTVEALSPIYAQPQKTEQAVTNDICTQLQGKLDTLTVGQTLQVTGKDGKVATIKKTSSGYTLSESDKETVYTLAEVKKLSETVVQGYASNQINYDSLTSQEIWELLDVQQQYADGKNNSYTNGQGCDSYWAAPGYENNGTTNADGTHNGEVPQYGTTTFDSLGLDANVTIEDAETGKKIDGVLLNDAEHSLTFTYGTKEQIAGYVDLSKYPDYNYNGTAYYGESGTIGGTKANYHPTTGAQTADFTDTVAESKKGDYWNGTSYDQKDKLTYTVNGGSLTGKNFYQVIGSVAYDKQGNDYTDKAAADAALEKLKADNKDGKYDSGVVVTYTDNGVEKYRVYGKVTNLKAYGYMTASANTSTNQNRTRNYSTWTPGNGAYWGQEEAGTYELRIQGLKKYGDTVTGQYGVGKSLDLSVTTEKKGSAKHLDVSQTSTTSNAGNGSGYYGSYTNTWTKTEDWRNCDGTSDVEGDGDGLYTSFVNLIHNFFSGKSEPVQKDSGSFTYEYNYTTETPLQTQYMVKTTEKEATVDYSYKTVEQHDVMIPTWDIIHVDPEIPDDDGDDEIIEEKTPDSPVLPGTPELPPVQDAKPDAAPDAPVLPADPVLPAVQDAHALPQTGVNWLAAIGLALSGMTLMITGAFASLLGKNAKH